MHLKHKTQHFFQTFLQQQHQDAQNIHKDRTAQIWQEALERPMSKSSDIPERVFVFLFAAWISMWKSLLISLTVTKNNNNHLCQKVFDVIRKF